MYIFPFGEVDKEKIDISTKYKLLECVNGVWRVTQKCKDNYSFESYYDYLRGKIDKPIRLDKQKQARDRESAIQSLLDL